ncbi:MAG: hypothetical protein OIF56_14955 [Cohaesibacter sp.]|nr:hypothetical protein [Cohaesibacter sp.]
MSDLSDFLGSGGSGSANGPALYQGLNSPAFGQYPALKSEDILFGGGKKIFRPNGRNYQILSVDGKALSLTSTIDLYNGSLPGSPSISGLPVIKPMGNEQYLYCFFIHSHNPYKVHFFAAVINLSGSDAAIKARAEFDVDSALGVNNQYSNLPKHYDAVYVGSGKFAVIVSAPSNRTARMSLFEFSGSAITHVSASFFGHSILSFGTTLVDQLKLYRLDNGQLLFLSSYSYSYWSLAKHIITPNLSNGSFSAGPQSWEKRYSIYKVNIGGMYENADFIYCFIRLDQSYGQCVLRIYKRSDGSLLSEKQLHTPNPMSSQNIGPYDVQDQHLNLMIFPEIDGRLPIVQISTVSNGYEQGLTRGGVVFVPADKDTTETTAFNRDLAFYESMPCHRAGTASTNLWLPKVWPDGAKLAASDFGLAAALI